MARKRKSKSARGRKPKSVVTLSDAWRAWVAENLVAGWSKTELVDRLVEQGVSVSIAVAEVTAIERSPAMPGCHALYRRVQQVEFVMRLQNEHRACAPDAGTVERRASVGAQEFFQRYYATNQPVVLTDVVGDWPARHWSPAGFRERFGDLEVEICAGRNADPACDRNFEALKTKMNMRTFLDQVERVGESNDVYLIANNRALERPEFSALFEDVTPDPTIFDPARMTGATSLWIGPAGTVTPLHHDVSNILFCQIYGRKRFTLIAPTETALFPDCEGFYVHVDPAHPSPSDNPDYEGVLVKTVDLQPGEALFIPAGWFHEVRSLDVSISFSLLNFRRPNNFGWYRPGHSAP